MTVVIGISGKIGSGKDYLTGKLVEELNSRGRTTAHSSFAKPLKHELGEIINLLKANRELTQEEANLLVAERFNMTAEQADWLVQRLYPELDVPDLNGWSRTLGVRGSLQILGTEIRRAQNPDYWTSRFFTEANSLEADFVFASDGRFPNEIDGVNAEKGVTLRLDISEETLRQRRDNRDGIQYTYEQLNHISETALDDYDEFDVRVGEVVDAVALADFIEKKTRLASVELSEVKIEWLLFRREDDLNGEPYTSKYPNPYGNPIPASFASKTEAQTFIDKNWPDPFCLMIEPRSRLVTSWQP